MAAMADHRRGGLTHPDDGAKRRRANGTGARARDRVAGRGCGHRGVPEARQNRFSCEFGTAHREESALTGMAHRIRHLAPLPHQPPSTSLCQPMPPGTHRGDGPSAPVKVASGWLLSRCAVPPPDAARDRRILAARRTPHAPTLRPCHPRPRGGCPHPRGHLGRHHRDRGRALAGAPRADLG